MFAFLAGWTSRTGSILPFYANFRIQKDEFTDKDIRNYTVYTDMSEPIILSADNKIPEAKVWQLNQPAYMREYPSAKVS